MKQAVTFTPWRSIRDGFVAPTGAVQSYTQSLASPCASCSTTPCCTHLPLHNFRVSTLGDLNYAGYLLNFAHIRLAIGRSGEWSVYYSYPCRYLDTVSAQCTIHDTPEQPRICVNYNPYGCWYRKTFASADSSEIVLMDRARFARLAEMLQFDEHQRLIDAPDFDTVRDALAGILVGADDDTAPEIATPPKPDAAFDGWIAELQADPPAQAPPEPLADAEVVMSASETRSVSPCTDCSAPCCETLVFPQGVPSAASGFDWFRFCLGYPGIELSIGPDQWSLVVKSTCQHLRDGQCSIYGKPERPLFCRYYDEWKCTYRVEFGRTRPPATFRVRLDQFDALLECFDLDATGAVVAASSHDAMRAHVEATVRAAAVAARPTASLGNESAVTVDESAVTVDDVLEEVLGG